MSSVDSREKSSQSVPGSFEDDSGSASDFSLPPRREHARLACPYYQRDSAKYTSRTCKGPGWASIARLKEHLYRVHLQSKHPCPRCYEQFERISDRDDHMRRDPPCEKGEANKAPEGFNKWQERELRSRKSAYSLGSEAERWYDIYRILFPGDDASRYPSPYYGPAEVPGGPAEAPRGPAEVSSGPAEVPSDELEQFLRMVKSESALRRLRTQILQVLQRQGQSPEPGQLASELTDLFVSSQMEMARHVRGRHGEVDPLDQEIDSGLWPWREPQSERRSSTSTLTYTGQHGVPEVEQSLGPQRSLPDSSSDSLDMMDSNVDLDHMLLTDDLIASTPALWGENPLLSYGQEAMAMHQSGTFDTIGAQFDMSYQPHQMGYINPVCELGQTGQLDVSPQDFPIDIPTQAYMYGIQQSLDGNEEPCGSHNTSPSIGTQTQRASRED